MREHDKGLETCGKRKAGASSFIEENGIFGQKTGKGTFRGGGQMGGDLS